MRTLSNAVLDGTLDRLSYWGMMAAWIPGAIESVRLLPTDHEEVKKGKLASAYRMWFAARVHELGSARAQLGPIVTAYLEDGKRWRSDPKEIINAARSSLGRSEARRQGGGDHGQRRDPHPGEGGEEGHEAPEDV